MAGGKRQGARATDLMGVKVPRLQRALVGLAVVQSGRTRKSWERKRSKRLKGQQPERKEKYRERHYRANPKQHHKLSKPSAKASIKIFVFTRIVLPAWKLNDRTVLFSHLVSSTQNRECLTESGPAPYLFLYCLTADQYWGSYSVPVAAQSR